MILFVDDERREMESYVEELRLSDYQVKFINKVDEAIEFFAENQSRLCLIILDIMMPTNGLFKDIDTEFGLRTGVHLYRKFREKATTLPVIILTNVSDDRVAKYFQQEANCTFLSKEDILPYELTENVRSILSHP
jgi:CheY-like chemotaxis protein